ncbi:glycosyltransferase family 2 protein [Alkalilacustris brevis]|uniref:glycosyltransferase family 2 protein n=1 Tax=Alkalilacustris brevis TaxID=2026338 RepID=UPI000E0DEE61|nr:glycosyltransferase family A protein [Alkalilacustris brevis]
MIPPASASLIIVSRGRSAELRRCLRAVAQLDHPFFELVVVADAEGRAALVSLGLADAVKTVPFEWANISRARNAGIAAAAGEIVAFIDDDAVPEPTWLSRLATAFTDERVAAATGFVRGRNGISFQHRAGWADALGRTMPLEADPHAISLHQGRAGVAVKTEGTNMAFRRAMLARMGGFDPAFHFYLDETDLNMRQAAEEQITAIVPTAQVHHGFAASSRRRADRVPLDLFEIGASTAVFLRKHAPPARHDMVLAALARDQRRRALEHMVAGRLEPRDVKRLLESLAAGVADGQQRQIARLPPIGDPQAPFRLFAPAHGPRPGRILAGWTWQGRKLRRAARRHLAAGAVVTVFRFSPTTLFHHMIFHPDGYWLQTGGLWGRSERSQPLLRACGFARRLRAETARIAPYRPVDSMIG